MTYSGPSLLSFTGAALSAVHFRMAEAAASGHTAAARGFVLCMNVFYLGRLLGGKLALRPRRDCTRRGGYEVCFYERNRWIECDLGRDQWQLVTC